MMCFVRKRQSTRRKHNQKEIIFNVPIFVLMKAALFKKDQRRLLYQAESFLLPKHIVTGTAILSRPVVYMNLIVLTPTQKLS